MLFGQLHNRAGRVPHAPAIQATAGVFSIHFDICPLPRDLRTPEPKLLRDWNAEGWYVRLGRAQFLAYITESGAQPPPEGIEVFRAVEGLPVQERRECVVRDVCLGFCYDPYAGLGVAYLNDLCRTDRNGTRCL